MFEPVTSQERFSVVQTREGGIAIGDREDDKAQGGAARLTLWVWKAGAFAGVRMPAAKAPLKCRDCLLLVL